MRIKQPAVAGTLESSDCMVTVEPVERGSGISLEIDSVVIHQYGEAIRKTILETLDRLDIADGYIRVNDKGALDCTIKARVECAAYRSNGQRSQLPWGGVIQ